MKKYFSMMDLHDVFRLIISDQPNVGTLIREFLWPAPNTFGAKAE